MCIQQEKLSVQIKLFHNSTFRDISVIGIPEVLMNIMSCHGFAQEYFTMCILKCRSKLVSYYLSKQL